MAEDHLEGEMQKLSAAPDSVAASPDYDSVDLESLTAAAAVPLPGSPLLGAPANDGHAGEDGRACAEFSSAIGAGLPARATGTPEGAGGSLELAAEVLLQGLAANDNAIRIAASGDNIASLNAVSADVAGNLRVVAWVGDDFIIHAKAYPAAPDGASNATPEGGVSPELSDLLETLGTAVEAQSINEGRLAILPLTSKSFATFWVTDLGFTAALIGKAFTLSAPALGEEPSHRSLWTAADVPPIPLPHVPRAFSARTGEDGKVIVTLDALDGNEAGSAGGSEGAGARDGLTLVIDLEPASTPAASGAASATPPSEATGSGGSPVVLEMASRDAVSGDASLDETLAIEDATLIAQGDAASDALDVLGEGGEDGASPFGALSVSWLDGLSGLDETGFAFEESSSGIVDDPAPPKPAAMSVTLVSGHEAVLQEIPGAVPGTAVLILTIAPAESDGAAPVVVEITNHARVESVSQPALDLGPALVSANSGIAVAWVEDATDAGVQGEIQEQSLSVRLYDLSGSVTGEWSPAWACNDGLPATISDIGLADYEGGNGEAGTAQADLAVVWVRNADVSGYGRVTSQVLGHVTHEVAAGVRSDEAAAGGSSEARLTPAESSGIAPGLDAPAAQHHGVADAPVTAVSEGDAHVSGASVPEPAAMLTSLSPPVFREPVVIAIELDVERGRAPEVASVGGGNLAIVWIEEQKYQGSNTETIKGLIVHPGDGSVMSLDLSYLMPEGLAAGSKLALTGTADGGFAVVWLAEADDGYDAMGATFAYAGGDSWLPADEAVALHHFDDRPRSMEITLPSGGDGELLALTWIEDGDHHTVSVPLPEAPASAGSALVTAGPSSEDAPGPAAGSDTPLEGSSGPDSVLSEAAPAQTDSGFSGIVLDEHQDVIVFAEQSSGSGSSGEGPTLADVHLTISVFDGASSKAPLQVAIEVSPAAGVDAWAGVDDGADLIAALADQISFAADFTADAAGEQLGLPDNDNADVQEIPMDMLLSSLQFANALSELGNEEVLTFDGSNIASIRTFDPI